MLENKKGTELHIIPEFKKIPYDFLLPSYVMIERKHHHDPLFDHIHGYVDSGTMLALLGSTKATITTLLKFLAGRVLPSSNHTGELLATDESIPSTAH